MCTAPWAAAYAEQFGSPRSPNTLVTTTIRPRATDGTDGCAHGGEDPGQVGAENPLELVIADLGDGLGKKSILGDCEDVERRVEFLDTRHRHDLRAGFAIRGCDGVRCRVPRPDQGGRLAGEFEMVHQSASGCLGTKPVGPMPPASPPPSMMNSCPVT